jgi:hypothetical protein
MKVVTSMGLIDADRQKLQLLPREQFYADICEGVWQINVWLCIYENAYLLVMYLCS